jgi:hypothetical protein
MLSEARKDLGLSGRPNRITRAYAKNNGDEFLTAPWCQMSITRWARLSGNEEAVLPEGDRAYTVYSAEDGRRLGRWHAGTADNLRRFAEPAAIVFFDWDGTNDIARIDHVGLIEHNLGDGRVATIEGNTGDVCKRRVRGADVIAGFWNPDYEGEDMPSAKEVADAVYERFTHTLGKDLWAVKEGLLKEGDKVDPRTALRQIWAYTKDGYARDREILAQLKAQDVTIKTLVDALASREVGLDPAALIEQIREEIGKVSVRLEVGDE